MSLPAADSPRLRDIDWRWALPRIALVFIVTRLLVLAVAVAVETTQPPPPEGVGIDDRPVIGSLTMWDGSFYLGIAEDGYHAEVNDFPDYAFLPAYPVVIRAVSLLAGGDLPLAAVLASNAAFGLALVVLYALSVRYLTPDRSIGSLWFLALAPGAIAFDFAYSESLFLLLAVSALLAAELRRPWLVGLALAAAALSRVPGILLLLPVLALYVQQRGWRPTGEWVPLALAPLALAAQFAAVWLVTDDPLAPINAQAFWNVGAEGRTTLGDTLGGAPLSAIDAVLHPAVLTSLLSIPFYLFLFVFFRHDRIRPAYWLVSLTAFAAVFTGASVVSNARFLAVAWPFSWVLANRRSRIGRGVVLVVFATSHVVLLWLAVAGRVAP